MSDEITHAEAEFIHAYKECAVWASVGADDEALDGLFANEDSLVDEAEEGYDSPEEATA